MDGYMHACGVFIYSGMLKQMDPPAKKEDETQQQQQQNTFKQ